MTCVLSGSKKESLSHNVSRKTQQPETGHKFPVATGAKGFPGSRAMLPQTMHIHSERERDPQMLYGLPPQLTTFIIRYVDLIFDTVKRNLSGNNERKQIGKKSLERGLSRWKRWERLIFENFRSIFFCGVGSLVSMRFQKRGRLRAIP